MHGHMNVKCKCTSFVYASKSESTEVGEGNTLPIAHIGIEWMWASRFLWLIPVDSDFSTHYIEESMEPTAPLFCCNREKNTCPYWEQKQYFSRFWLVTCTSDLSRLMCSEVFRIDRVAASSTFEQQFSGIMY
jgi:hypothetical protein